MKTLELNTPPLRSPADLTDSDKEIAANMHKTVKTMHESVPAVLSLMDKVDQIKALPGAAQTLYLDPAAMHLFDQASGRAL